MSVEKDYEKLHALYKRIQTNSRIQFRKYKSEIDDLKSALERTQEEKKKLEIENKSLKERINNLKKSMELVQDDETIIKFILKLHAENKLIGRIHKAIQERFDVVWEFDRIQKYLNIENLDTELRKYYYEKRDEYEQIRQIEDNRERLNDIENLNYLLNQVNIIIENADLNDKGDQETFLKAIRSFTDLIDKKKALNKELSQNEVVISDRTKKLNEELNDEFDELAVIQIKSDEIVTN